jgi:tRNA(Arg) A34 adenosine deaminase TadA
MEIPHPHWFRAVAPIGESYATPEERMRLAVDLARQNVTRDLNGPFGAAVFEADSGRLVAVGVNSVERFKSSPLHAEVMAILAAHAAVRSDSLRTPRHELYSSAEPCAMCLGAILWSGISRTVFAATREDVEQIGFEEGPVFPATFAYLAARGTVVEPGPLRHEGAAVLQLYLDRGGEIYSA